eukprot:TRINITY_DN9560_c0_g1_i1.p2 TRINITY_DN9560_c0_g1~~TRINITY_DN9560_c0_g1_i1.p2  ORF type:complete len:191 (-),score=28.50 TRINITY_DN9560_c0_g1_i1:67-639(-)
MAEPQAPTALSDDDLAAVTGGKGPSDGGPLAGGESLDEMMKAVMQERMGILNEQIDAQIAEIRAHNATVDDLNKGLSLLCAVEKGMEGTGPSAQVSLRYLAAEWGNRPVEEFTKVLGLPAEAVQDGRLGREEIQSAIAGVNTRIDAVTTEAGMDMLRLQSLVDTRVKVTDMMNDLLSKSGKSLPPPGDRR